MVEKNYYAHNAYTPESACEFIDALLTIEKAFVFDVASKAKELDVYHAGVMDGICIAIAAFGEANGVIPYSDDGDAGFVDYAIENGKESFDAIAKETSLLSGDIDGEMVDCPDCEGCECGEDGDGEDAVKIEIGSTGIDDPEMIKNLQDLLAAILCE